jgi:glucosamine--fructose-6-phosphate aminotransferase (isomerizing)
MCGIVGYTGPEPALPVLLAGLARLEYRGYDSAGVALQQPAGVWRRRRAGKLAELAGAVSDAPASARTGIGHTRWATHGKPVERNAHPHVDCRGRVAIVHNGIIENYLELADGLAGSGHELTSETDTEVLAHLLEEAMAGGATLAAAMREVLRRVEGSFAVAAIAADDPDVIVAGRRSSPLIVGRTDGAGLVASDIPAILAYTREVYVVDDDRVVEVRPGSITATDLEGRPVELDRREVPWDLETAEKGGYEDFMLKEMHEQPTAVAETLRGRLQPAGRLRLDEARGLSDDDLRAVDKVFIVGCGTSFHAGLVAKYAIEHWARIPVEIDIASEFRYRDPVLDARTLVVGISQSGETLDTMEACRYAKSAANKAKVLAIVNVVDSSMAREADAVLYTRAGPEVGVASTKCHLAQIVAAELLALHLGQLRGTLVPDDVRPLFGALRELPELVGRVLGREAEIGDAARRFVGARDFFFLGRGVSYPVALEGALKLKEISYLRAEGYPAGEMKHGPIALIDEDAVVVAVATRSRLHAKMLSNIAEMKARGATVVGVVNEGDTETAACVDVPLWVPRVAHELFSPVVDVVALQLFAYALAKAHGRDVDKPRNLAKTVTVE